MLLIVGTIRIRSESVESARADMAQVISVSRAEDGCQEYCYAEDVLDRGLIHVTEVWRDQASLDRHAVSGHVALYRTALQKFGVSGRALRIYEVGPARTL